MPRRLHDCATFALIFLIQFVVGCQRQEVAPTYSTRKVEPIQPIRSQPPTEMPRPQAPFPKGLQARTAILTYHDMVSVRDSKALWFDCTPEELRSQIQWLKSKGAKFGSISTLIKRLEAGEDSDQNTVCITFADNYQGFYKLAWPILKQESIPVTLFIHTDHVGSTKNRPKMSWDQLKELSKDPLITIASQTRSHPKDLTQLTDEQILEEFKGSKDAFVQHMGLRVEFLAYPNGKFDSRVARIAKKSGYRAAFTEEQRPAENAEGFFVIPRYVHTKYQEAWRDLGLEQSQ